MKLLVNEYVEHKKFGRGLITNEEKGKITVDFDSQIGNKIFLFPDAFEQFLEFEDKSLQEESLTLVQDKKRLLTVENERKWLEHKRLEEERKQEELVERKKNRKTATVKKPKVAKQTIKKSSEPTKSELFNEND